MTVFLPVYREDAQSKPRIVYDREREVFITVKSEVFVDYLLNQTTLPWITYTLEAHCPSLYCPHIEGKTVKLIGPHEADMIAIRSTRSQGTFFTSASTPRVCAMP